MRVEAVASRRRGGAVFRHPELVPAAGVGSADLRFYSRYRHFRDRKHQQNKGYQHRESQVNRNDLYYGMYYGSVRSSGGDTAASLWSCATFGFRT